MREMKSILYFLTVNIRFTFIVFWTILTSIYGLAILFNVFMEMDDVLFQPYIPIYIFSMVIGMWTVKNALPYLLKMGITRKMMYGTIWLYFILFAIVNTLLAHVFTVISNLLGKHQTGGLFTFSIYNGDEAEVTFDFNHIAQFMVNDSWMNQIIVDVIICFVALTFMFIVGLVFHQYGLIGGFSFIGLLFASLMIIIATDRITDIIVYIYNHYTMRLYYQIWLGSAIVYLLSYLILRRFTLK